MVIGSLIIIPAAPLEMTTNSGAQHPRGFPGDVFIESRKQVSHVPCKVRKAGFFFQEDFL